MKNENVYQPTVKSRLYKTFPGCTVTKQDAGSIQGIPDLLILYNNKWAMLECKRSKNDPHRPNQDYYVDYYNKQSFARFIYPENEDEVFEDLIKFMNK